MSGNTKLIFLKICLSYVLFLIVEPENYINILLGFIFIFLNVLLIELIAKFILSLWRKCKSENIYFISIAILLGVTFCVTNYFIRQEMCSFRSLLSMFLTASYCCGFVTFFLEHTKYAVRIRASGGNSGNQNCGCK